MNYAEVSSLLARTVGSFYAIPHTGSAAPNPDNGSTNIKTPSGEFDLAGRDWLVYRLKCLDEKIASSLDIALRLINDADFSDLRRINDLVLEMKNEARSSLAPRGHHYASTRACRFASLPSQTMETWGGITQLIFSQRLAELETSEVAAKLKYLRDTLAGGGLIANLAGSAEALKSGCGLLAGQFSRFGAPRQRRLYTEAPVQNHISEVFASSSLQIGFAAMRLQAAAFDTREQIAEIVLAHQLSTGALWEHIRMKGGAYGASASSGGLERCFSMSTYRDPNPLNSLDVFSSVLKTSSPDFSVENELVKMIIGCYSRETRPHTPSENSIGDFLRFLTRIDDDYRRRKLERLINTSVDDISTALGNLASQNSFGNVVITGIKDAEQAAKKLGTEVQMLPV
jgi:Zn-dependent M16 (insulinase) family peptidase